MHVWAHTNLHFSPFEKICLWQKRARILLKALNPEGSRWVSALLASVWCLQMTWKYNWREQFVSKGLEACSSLFCISPSSAQVWRSALGRRLITVD